MEQILKPLTFQGFPNIQTKTRNIHAIKWGFPKIGLTPVLIHFGGIFLYRHPNSQGNYNLLTWPSGSCGVRKDPPTTFCASEVGVTSRNVYDVYICL